MTEHTATPWQIHQRLDGSWIVHENNEIDKVIAVCTRKANAIFIVKACNLHKGLAQTAMNVLWISRNLDDWSHRELTRIITTAAEEAESVLAKATEED